MDRSEQSEKRSYGFARRLARARTIVQLWSTHHFLEAVKNGDSEAVSQALALKPWLAQARTQEGYTALVLAVRGRHEAVARELLSLSDAHALSGESKIEALVAAARMGGQCCLQLVLAHLPRHKLRQDGREALACAASLSRVECVQLLLEVGVDARAVNRDIPNRSILSLAMEGASTILYQDKIECVRRLIPCSDVTTCDSQRRTPLQQAAERGECEFVAMLLAHGSEIGLPVKAQGGEAALCEAAQKGYSHCVEHLLAAGVVVEKNAQGGGACELAMAHAIHEPSPEAWQGLDLFAGHVSIAQSQAVLDQPGVDARQLPRMVAFTQRAALEQLLRTATTVPLAEVASGESALSAATTGRDGSLFDGLPKEQLNAAKRRKAPRL